MSKYIIAVAIVVVLGVWSYALQSGGNAREVEKVKDGQGLSEVVNGLQLILSSELGRDGQPKVEIHIRNAGSDPLDIVEMAPLFLEVQEGPGCWRTFQHPRCDSRKLGTMFTFEPGHDESEMEPLSAFTKLEPGKHLIRVSMAFDRGMAQDYQSKRLWIGVVRSNAIEVTVPEDKGKSLAR
ncbi:MAG: hypothetical protein ACYS9T_00660 [Planctomycetota bacterium]